MAFTSLLFGAFLLVAAGPVPVQPYAAGPPVDDGLFNQTCSLMTPLHNDLAPTAGTGGYSIETDLPRSQGYKGFKYTAGKEYTVTLKGSNATFRGFLVIAHVLGEDHTLLGRFIPQNESQQTLDCSLTNASNERESTIAHKNSDRLNFQSMILKWKAPSDGNELVDFRFTVVHNFSTFYVYQRASLNGLYKPTKDPEDYRLTFRTPPNCTVSSCDVFVGIDTNAGNPNFLDIYLEGIADGWVAVGFTEMANMYSANVVACNRNPTNGQVQGLDTYNDPNKQTNKVDKNQNNIVQFSHTYSNGRLLCRKKGNSLPNSLDIHEDDPEISSKKYNPVLDKAKGEGDNFPRLPLVRAHGTLMITAWPLFGVTGIFFASWMRPALPKGQWFQVHRAFMVVSLFIGAVGIAMVFIGDAREDNPRGLIQLGSSNPVGTVHFSIGLFIILLHIINPIIALFRCPPGKKGRSIFNMVHGLIIGLGVGILAFVNVGLGTYMFNHGVSNILYVYIGYISFIIVLFGVMFIIFSITASFVQDSDNQQLAPPILRFLLKYISSPAYTSIDNGKTVKVNYGTTNEPEDPEGDTPTPVPAKQHPSKDSPIRWASLILYLAVTTPLIFAMIILAAVGSINT